MKICVIGRIDHFFLCLKIKFYNFYYFFIPLKDLYFFHYNQNKSFNYENLLIYTGFRKCFISFNCYKAFGIQMLLL